jgi:hypothetical protein
MHLARRCGAASMPDVPRGAARPLPTPLDRHSTFTWIKDLAY